ncbi:MAG: hypothetical protein AAGA10_30105, partial [Bacteroidota bacterium]
RKGIVWWRRGVGDVRWYKSRLTIALLQSCLVQNLKRYLSICKVGIKISLAGEEIERRDTETQRIGPV